MGINKTEEKEWNRTGEREREREWSKISSNKNFLFWACMNVYFVFWCVNENDSLGSMFVLNWPKVLLATKMTKNLFEVAGQKMAIKPTHPPPPTSK